MSAIAFITPGLIDVRAFTLFGINSKPNTKNPIGFFGTGLKYATAICCRLGAKVEVWIGTTKYIFFTRPSKFRDKDFSAIRMKRETWTFTDVALFKRANYNDMPYTTELGKTWDAWQAYRELASNTIDEDGEIKIVDDNFDPIAEGIVASDRTIIIVRSTSIANAHMERDKVFLPDGLKERAVGQYVQILDKPSKHLYYRGLRVADIPKPALFTYNFLAEQELTEDRTIKNEYSARINLAYQVVKSDDENFIDTVLTASDQNWEHGLDFDYVSQAPSEAFNNVMRRRRHAVPQTVQRYYSAWRSSASVEAPDYWELYPRPWRARGHQIVDNNGNEVLRSTLAFEFVSEICDLINKADLT